MTEIEPKLSRLYREAASEGPPTALDAAILAAARERATQPRRRARASWVRWMAPASALATLLVAVSLAFLIERERAETLEDTAVRESSPRPQSAPPASATPTTKAKAADGAAPAGAAKLDAPAATGRTAAEAAIKKEAAPAPAAPGQTAVQRPAAAAPPAVQAFPPDSRERAAESKLPAPTAAPEANVARDSALGTRAGAPAAATAGSVAPQRQSAAQRSPEAWLAEIGRLKREGRDQEAAEQLTEFRKAYPAYAVPENLRGLP